MRFSLPSIIITITSNEPWNRETHKTNQNPPITNYKPLFPRRSAKMFDGSEKRKRQLAFERHNSRVFEKLSNWCHSFLVVVSSSRHKLPWGLWLLEGLVHLAHHVGPKCAKKILFFFNIIIKKYYKKLFLVEIFSGLEIFTSTENNWLQTIVCSCAIAKNVADDQSRPLSIRYPGPAERYTWHRTKGSQRLGKRLAENMLVSRASRTTTGSISPPPPPKKNKTKQANKQIKKHSAKRAKWMNEIKYKNDIAKQAWCLILQNNYWLGDFFK